MDSAVAVESSAAAVATPLVANSSSSAHSSNSSSSTSSGYGSATTTPTNPASAGSNSNGSSHSHYDAHSTTPVGTVEPIPVATVAAVTPYYSETYADSHQRSSYYQSHSYPMASQAQVMPHYNSYDSYLGAGTYQHMSSVERSGSSARHASTFAYASSEKLAAVNSKLPVSPAQQLHGHHTSNIGGSSTGAYGKLAAHTGESSSTSAKPQAAATPFYAQPLHATNQTPVGYFDPYKYNVPTKMTSHGPTTDYANYGGHLSNAASATYQQHQSYYAAGKALQDATYTAAVKPLPASPVNSRQHVSSPYATSGGGATNNSTYYDKYMYTTTATPAASAGSMNPATYPPHVPPPPSSATHPPQYPPEMSADSYRKTPSWHWSMDYAAGNCRSLPPPLASNSIPTAAVPPTNAAYLQQANSTRDMYYPHDKYAGKYDKYNSYYHHQQYMSAARNVWPASPHSHLGPPIAERLSHLPPGATVAATHPSLPHHYASASAAASGATRQSCCTQPFQQQNCYYPRPPHLIATNNYPPHAQQPHFAPTGSNNASTNNGSGKYGMLDYAPHANKTKSPTDLYAAASPYEAATAHLNYNYPSAAGANQHYVGSTPAATAHQSSLNPAIAPTQMHGDLSTAFYNDLNVQATYDNYASAAMQQPTQHQQYQQYQQHQHQQHHAAATRTQPPPSYAANSAKASLLDYRKTTAATARQGVDCYMAQSAQLTNLDEHAAGGNSYAPYELNSVSSALYASRAEVESADKTGTNTKNLSLRDFLSTWNEDEEDYAASVSGATTEELNFIEPESQTTESTVPLQAGDRESGKPAAYVHDNVTGVAQSYKATTASLPLSATQQQQQQQIMENHLQFKSSFNTRPKIHVGITVDSTVDVETNQYINLPDIIIDIEKSNNVAPAKEETSMEMKDIPFGGFDVEKELDELQSKKVKMPVVEVVRPIRSDSVITQKVEALKPAKASYECNVSSPEMGPTPDAPSFKGLLLHATDADFLHSDNQVNATCSPKPIIAYTPPKMAPDQDAVEDEVAYALSTVHADADAVPSGTVLPLDNPAPFIKDIECDNNSHSNESTFEKEYETFINKIGSDTVVNHLLKDSNKVNNTTSDKVNADSEPPTDICKLKSDEVILCAETNEDIKRNSETEREFAQNIKAFSKFYKRKRKFSESRKDEKHKKPALEEIALITNDSRNINQNFPKGHTKKCRKRKDSERHTPQVNGDGTLSVDDKHRMYDAYARNRKALAFYYKLLRAQRRFRFSRAKLDTSALVQRHIATLKERRLPLIKRQSAKKYSAGGSRMRYNPKTLKCLSVGIVNTEAFRDGILGDMENQAIKDIAIAVAKEELCGNSSESQSSLNDADVATPADKSDVESIEKFANDTEKPFVDIIADELLPKNVVPMQCNVIVQGHVDDNDDAEEFKPIDGRSDSSLNCTPDAMDVESGPMESIIADISLQSTVENTNANDVQEPSHTREVEEREEQGETDTAAWKVNEPQQFVEILPNANADKNTEVFDTASQTTELEPKLSFGSPANSLCSQGNVSNNDNDNLLSESNKYVGVIEVDENSNASLTDNSSVSSGTSSSSSSSDNSTDSSSTSSSSDDDDTLSNASEKSDLNELEELEKELSQHRSVADTVLSRVSEKFDDHTSDCEYGDMVREGSNAENVNDIANLKKMLEGDSDEHDERQSNVVETVNKQSNITTDEDELTCGLQNSSNADKRQTTQNDCVDAVAVHSAVQVAGNEQCAVEHNVEEVEQKSSDVTQENLDAEQLTVREEEAISNEARENLQDEVLEISDDDSEISEVLATSIDVLDTSEEELKHWDEVLEKSNDVQKKFGKVQVRADEEQTKSIEISAQCDEVQPKSIEVQVECEKVQSKSIEVETECDEVQPKSNEVQAECDDMTSKTNEIQVECDEVKSKSNEVQTRCDEVKSKSNEVKPKSNEVQAECDEVKSKSNEVQAEYEELLPKSNEKQMGCDEVQTECDEVKSKSNEVQAEYEELPPKSIEVQMECDEVQHKFNEVQAECDDVPLKSIEVPTKSQEVLENTVEEKKKPKTSASSVDDSDTPIASLKSLATACMDLNGLSPRIHSLNQELLDQIGHTIADELDQVEHKIPKLSDLCKIALSSSFETSAPTFISDTNASADSDDDDDADAQHKPLERELSVEEALAEMYRQAGVTSDPEDYDMEDKDAQDVLLINLEEILVSDSDLYVLQCDMNENVLSVVAHADAVEAASHANVTANAERVNGLQLMEVLDDLQRNEVDELQMTATRESVQNESETTAASSSTKPTTMAPLTDKNADKATSTRTPAAFSQTAEHEENNDNSLTSQFDLPTIHHEEIVPENYKTFEKENFIKYLHAKYVQKNISKFYHANRILKKYRRGFCKK